MRRLSLPPKAASNHQDASLIAIIAGRIIMPFKMTLNHEDASLSQTMSASLEMNRIYIN